jgi:hypothetical protein
MSGSEDEDEGEHPHRQIYEGNADTVLTALRPFALSRSFVKYDESDKVHKASYTHVCAFSCSFACVCVGALFACGPPTCENENAKYVKCENEKLGEVHAPEAPEVVPHHGKVS